MLSVDEAIDELLKEAVVQTKTEQISLVNGLSRVLAESIKSAVDVPPADNSAMDGYAVYAEENMTSSLTVSQRIVAGSSPKPLSKGTAARIFTGAEIPKGANAVVMQENCEVQEDSVYITKLPVEAENVRPQGQDIEKGAEVISIGARLRAQDLGLIASVGVGKIKVFQKLKVAILSTGDELAEPGDKLKPGQIYNSNRTTMATLCSGLGLEVIDCGKIKDSLLATKEALSTAAEEADVVLTSGGVSVGEEDYIKAAIEQMGVLDLWKVAIKPGKPLAFGHVNGTPIIGLPGNPASVFVTFLILVRPYLLKSQGAQRIMPGSFKVPALFDRKAVKRCEFLRAKLENGSVEIHERQSSGILSSASWGDGFVVQNVDQAIESGQNVDFIPYSNLL